MALFSVLPLWLVYISIRWQLAPDERNGAELLLLQQFSKLGEYAHFFISAVFAVMMTVAAAIPTKGVVGMLLPIITGTFYYSAPENKWAEEIHPLLPRWILVDDIQAVKSFYEGGESIPWEHWLSPLAAWLAFYAAFYLTLICLSTILRRQWVEHERLAYPLVQAPLAMIGQEEDGSLLKPFFRNWIMWIGFAIPFFCNTLIALHHYFPEIATPSLGVTVQPFDGGKLLRLSINFLILGLGYFINLGIGFSLWFFYLASYLQDAIFGYMGVYGNADLGHWSYPIRGHQMMGAMTILLVAGVGWPAEWSALALTPHKQHEAVNVLVGLIGFYPLTEMALSTFDVPVEGAC